MAVDPSHVDATMPLLSGQVATMIELQLATGMRPGEVCAMSMEQIDRSDPAAWIYRLRQHKTLHRGKDRFIPLLPQKQRLLVPFLRADDEPLFQPREAEAERRREQRAARVTRLTPSQRARKPKASPAYNCPIAVERAQALLGRFL